MAVLTLEKQHVDESFSSDCVVESVAFVGVIVIDL